MRFESASREQKRNTGRRLRLFSLHPRELLGQLFSDHRIPAAFHVFPPLFCPPDKFGQFSVFTTERRDPRVVLTEHHSSCSGPQINRMITDRSKLGITAPGGTPPLLAQRCGRQSSPPRSMKRMGSWRLNSSCPTHSPRRSLRLRQEFRLGGGRLTRVSSGDVRSLMGERARKQRACVKLCVKKT